MKRIQDEVAVITGAANGLGQAIAFRLAQEGADVVLGDIDEGGLSTTASEIRKTGPMSIGNEDAVDSLRKVKITKLNDQICRSVE